MTQNVRRLTISLTPAEVDHLDQLAQKFAGGSRSLWIAQQIAKGATPGARKSIRASRRAQGRPAKGGE